MSVCQLAISKTTCCTSWNFPYMLPVAAVQSSFNIAIRYVLPVLWMSSCFDTMSASEWKPNVIPRHAHSLLLEKWFSKLLSLARWQHHVVATGARSAVVSCRVEFLCLVIFSCLLLNGDLSKIFLRFFFCFLTALNTCTDYWHLWRVQHLLSPELDDASRCVQGRIIHGAGEAEASGPGRPDRPV